MKLLNNAIYSINAAALLLGAAGFLSRLLGILRDRLLAAQFGASRELDIYYAAFQIPDFMSIIFLLGAGSAAILPIFQEYLSEDKDKARNLISDLITFFLWGAVVFSIVAFFLAPFLVRILAPGFSAQDRSLTVVLMRIMLCSPLLFGLSGILSSVVQSFQRFFSYAIAPLFYNLGIIIGIVLFVPWWGVKGLALGVILGAGMHFLVQLLTVKDLGFAPRLIWRGISSGVKRVLKLSFPRVLSISLTQITGIILVAVASTLMAGSISVFQLAQNLYFVPIGIFGLSYATAIFPILNRAYLNKNGHEFFQKLFLGIRSIIFWIAPATTLMIVLRAHIVRVALGAGAFSWSDTRLTAAVLAALTISMFSDALVSFFIKGFYALENTWMPLVINLGTAAFSILLAVFLARMLGGGGILAHFITGIFRVSDLSDSRVVGLALGFSLGSFIDIWLLYKYLKRLAAQRFNECELMPLGSIFKIIFGSALAGGAAYLVRISFAQTLPLITFWRVLAQGAIAGVVGLAVYFGLLLILKEENTYALLETVKRRLFKIKILPRIWDGESNIHQREV